MKPTTTDSAPLLLPELENFGEGTVISEGSLSAAEFHTVQERGGKLIDLNNKHKEKVRIKNQQQQNF